MIGYKVMRVDGGRLRSGADSRQTFPLKRGTVLRMPGLGLYLAPARQYVLDHYSGLADEEVLLTLEFDPSKLTSGNLSDREPELSVREATIVGYEVLRTDNPARIEAIKARLLSTGRPESNPTEKRLRWIAGQYSPDVLAVTAATLAEATGQDRISRILYKHAREASTEWAGGRDWHNDSGDWYVQKAFNILGEQKDGFTTAMHTRFDRYLPWAAREFRRLRYLWSNWLDSPRTEQLHTSFRAVVDWAEAERVDLNRYTASDALDAAEAWGEARVGAGVPQGTVVYQFADGWTVQELNEQDALDAEGAIMQHCLDTYESDRGEQQGRVWEYDPPVVMDTSGMPVKIYSLRDPQGQPHATMEFIEQRDWHPGAPYVSQLKGKQNAEPKYEYLARMVEFRRARLSASPAVSVEFPDHADGIAQPLVGAFRPVPQEFNKDAVGDETYLIYADGTVLDAVDLEDHVNILKAEAVGLYGSDRPAISEFMIQTMDRLEPRDLGNPVLDVDWIYWAAWLAHAEHGGRADIAGSTDEMVAWLSGVRGIAAAVAGLPPPR